MSFLQASRRGDFEVAIICALPLEYDAVTCIFNEFWDEDYSSSVQYPIVHMKIIAINLESA
ncbi:hypothetical protein AUP68_06261 [Ilyonectria robusta]